jgi:Ca2+-transporting ATPase
VVAVKGAPERVAAMARVQGDAAREAGERMMRDGLRVLAVACGSWQGELPDDPAAFPLQFVGLVGLEDPVREGVPAAVAECRRAGIRVVVISGDHPATVASVGARIGVNGRVLGGAELEKLDADALRAVVREVDLYARVLPEQKLRLVDALKANGEVVAMTGDGVNDAPALRSAHIGIAMGGRGTDVAREAAQVVLLDDDFTSLERAVRVGRRIVDNLQKALAYILAVHLPILALTVLPIFLGWPLVLLPVHIAFLHLVIDPACSVVFEAEPEESDVMRRPPTPPAAPLFSRKLILRSLMQGLSVSAVVLAVFAVARARGQGDAEARALTFTTLVIANLGLILVNRSFVRTASSTLKVPNPALWWVVLGALALLALVIYVPPLRGLFRFDLLHAGDLLLCLAGAVISLAAFELTKTIRRRSAW